MKKIVFLLFLFLLITGISLYIVFQNGKPFVQGITTIPSVTPTAQVIPSRTPMAVSSGQCSVHGELPDPACTPGDVFPDATKEVICVSGYTAKVRDVTVAEKRTVYAEYGFSYPQRSGAFEADHFVPLELGGSNDIKNLWPEASVPNPGFHQKDEVENYLHKEVCDGRMNLKDAQTAIETNWLTVYSSIPR